MAEVRMLESGKLLCVEGKGSREDLNNAFEKIKVFVQERKVPIRGDKLSFFYDDTQQIDYQNTHFAAAVELSGEVFGDGEVMVITQSIMKVACEVHRGGLDNIGESLVKLKTWINENGYKINGAVREYYIQSASPGETDSANMVTELQIPVVKVD